MFTAIAAIIAAAATGIATAVAAGDRAKARALQEKAASDINAILPPDFEPVAPEEVDGTLLERMFVPQEGRDAQMSAVDSLQDIVSNKGADAEFLNDQRLIESALGRMNAGTAGAAAQRAAARGIGTQGLYAADLVNSQNAANQAGNMASDAAARKQQRYLAAIDALGSQGSRLNEQDYRRAFDTASAGDRMNMFNAGQRRSAAEYENAMRQQEYENAMRKAAAAANAGSGLAAGYTSDADYAGRVGAGIGQSAVGVGQAVSGLSGYGYDPGEYTYSTATNNRKGYP